MVTCEMRRLRLTYFDELENLACDIIQFISIYPTRIWCIFKCLHDKSISVELGARPSGPWELGNAAFRDDDGVVKFGDVLTYELERDTGQFFIV